jgi:hypothetical protein
MSPLRYLAALLLALVLLAAPAFAGTIDFTPIANQVILAIAAVIAALAAWLLQRLVAWVGTKTDLTKTQLDEQLQQSFNEAALRGIAWAGSQAQKEVGGIVGKVEVGGPFVGMAAQYVIDHWPDLIKRSGLTTDSVVKAIEARLTPASEAADALAQAKAAAPKP